MFWLTADKYEVRNSPYYDDIVDLQSLIFGSLSAAGWLMFMAGGILIAEGIAIILVIYGLQSTWKMVFTVMVSYFVSSMCSLALQFTL